MNTVAIARSFFQIIAFAIFIYQMQESLSKFMGKPIVTEKSNTKFDSIIKPVLYICQDNQIGYHKARLLGYDCKLDFIAGKINGSDAPTWNGAEGNITYDELAHVLYKADFDGVKVYFDGWMEENEVKTKEAFKILYGFCRVVEIGEVKEKVYLASTKKITRTKTFIRSGALQKEFQLRCHW